MISKHKYEWLNNGNKHKYYTKWKQIVATGHIRLDRYMVIMSMGNLWLKQVTTINRFTSLGSYVAIYIHDSSD